LSFKLFLFLFDFSPPANGRIGNLEYLSYKTPANAASPVTRPSLCFFDPPSQAREAPVVEAQYNHAVLVIRFSSPTDGTDLDQFAQSVSFVTRFFDQSFVLVQRKIFGDGGKSGIGFVKYIIVLLVDVSKVLFVLRIGSSPVLDVKPRKEMAERVHIFGQPEVRIAREVSTFKLCHSPESFKYEN
jgi:hypothetical protein